MAENTEEFATRKTFRSYLFFLSGQLFSILGSSIVQFVIIWWITIETQSAIYLSISAFLSFLPQIIITPFAGVLSDRWNRKIIMVTADSMQAFLTFVLFLMFFFNVTHIWLVLFMNTLRSVFHSLHWPAYNAVVPVMVPKDKLSRVNGINFLSWGLINIISPVISATLLSFFPINQVFLIDVITWAIAIVPLLLIHIPSVKQATPEIEKPSFLTDFKIGIKEVIAVPGLMSLIIYAMLSNFFFRPYMVLMPYLVGIIHNGDKFDLAFVFSFMSIGNIIGASIGMVKKKWKHIIRIQMIGTIIVYFCYFILVLAPLGAFLILGISVLIVGIIFPLMNTLYMTILQTAVPKDKVGRITSIDHTLSMAITPIGAIISGPLAESIGLYNLYITSAILGIVEVSLVWIFTSARKLEHAHKSELAQRKEVAKN